MLIVNIFICSTYGYVFEPGAANIVICISENPYKTEPETVSDRNVTRFLFCKKITKGNLIPENYRFAENL